MTPQNNVPPTGHCTCKSITYTLAATPLITHCCHCTWCQRETGSAFCLNSQIECYNFKLTSTTKPMAIDTPSPSGDGQLIHRCPHCYVSIYSHYGGYKYILFVKAGTLSNECRERIRPDVHIFTSTKVEWVDLEGERKRGVPISEAFYDRQSVWSEESNARLEKLKKWVEAGEEGGGGSVRVGGS